MVKIKILDTINKFWMKKSSSKKFMSSKMSTTTIQNLVVPEVKMLWNSFFLKTHANTSVESLESFASQVAIHCYWELEEVEDSL